MDVDLEARLLVAVAAVHDVDDCPARLGRRGREEGRTLLQLAGARVFWLFGALGPVLAAVVAADDVVDDCAAPEAETEEEEKKPKKSAPALLASLMMLVVGLVVEEFPREFGAEKHWLLSARS